MLRIILCDDDPFILNLSADKINAIIQSNRLDAKLACVATNSSELLTFVRSNPDRYLIFLDLDFGSGKLNGMDVAKALRQTDSDCKIVFTTNHHEMAMDVLKCGVEPFGFLEKSTDILKLASGYYKYIHMLLFRSDATEAARQPSISLNIGSDEYVTIALADIIFVETEKNKSHGITYHTVNGSSITVISSLDAEQQRLGDDFLKPHRSYLVNKRHLLGMTDGYLKLSNQQEVPCSFRQRREVKKWLR